MFFFNDVVNSALKHLLEGRNVRLIGSSGSGRSTTFSQIVQRLELSGAEVYYATADEGAHGALMSGPDFPDSEVMLSRRHSLSHLDRSPKRASRLFIAVDDAGDADPDSARDLDWIAARHVTLRTLGFSKRVKPHWPEVTLAMPQLTFDQITQLLEDTLGGTPSMQLVTRLLTKSGGNPMFAHALAENALLVGQLSEGPSGWQMQSPSLWHENLRPFVDWYLKDLTSAELDLLQRFSDPASQSLGPDAYPIASQDSFNSLTLRGLIRSTRFDLAPSRVYIHPPILTDAFRHNPLGLSVAVEVQSSVVTSTSDDLTIAARLSQQEAEEHAAVRLASWEQKPTPVNATAYLSQATGSDFERSTIDRMLNDTVSADAPLDDTLRFAFLKAQWLACDRNDLPAGLQVLYDLADARAEARPRATAAAYLLRAFMDRMPTDYERVLDPEQDPTGGTDLTLAFLHLFAGIPDPAVHILEVARIGRYRGLARSLLLPLGLTMTGQVDAGYLFASRAQQEATENRDRLAFLGSTYGAAFASLVGGRPDRLQHAVTQAMLAGRPTMLMRSFVGAVVSFSAIGTAAREGRSPLAGGRIRESEYISAHPGPLLGSGPDAAAALAKSQVDLFEFDLEMARTIRARRERGYHAAAVGQAVISASVVVGDEIAAEVELLTQGPNIPLYSRSLELVGSLHRREFGAVRATLGGQAFGDEALCAQIAGAAVRRAERESDSELLSEIYDATQRAEAASSGSFEAFRVPLDPDTFRPLTPREREIALLAGMMKNSEIARRLSISLRTVEAHLSNAMRKTDTHTRAELAASGLMNV